MSFCCDFNPFAKEEGRLESLVTLNDAAINEKTSNEDNKYYNGNGDTCNQNEGG